MLEFAKEKGGIFSTVVEDEKIYFRIPNLNDKIEFEESSVNVKTAKAKLEFGISLYRRHACDEKGKSIYKNNAECKEDWRAGIAAESVTVKLINYYIPSREALDNAKKPSSKTQTKGSSQSGPKTQKAKSAKQK